jgi:hypothetical protein
LPDVSLLNSQLGNGRHVEVPEAQYKPSSKLQIFDPHMQLLGFASDALVLPQLGPTQHIHLGFELSELAPQAIGELNFVLNHTSRLSDVEAYE